MRFILLLAVVAFAAACPAFSWTTDKPLKFTVNSPVDIQFIPQNTTTAVEFAVVGGAFPTGVSMDATGHVTGTPTDPGFPPPYTDSLGNPYWEVLVEILMFETFGQQTSQGWKNGALYPPGYPKGEPKEEDNNNAGPAGPFGCVAAENGEAWGRALMLLAFIALVAVSASLTARKE